MGDTDHHGLVNLCCSPPMSSAYPTCRYCHVYLDLALHTDHTTRYLGFFQASYQEWNFECYYCPHWVSNNRMKRKWWRSPRLHTRFKTFEDCQSLLNFMIPIYRQDIIYQMAGWCSWLSRIVNTDKVLGSSPSLVNIFAQGHSWRS